MKADSEGQDQTVRMCRLVWAFAVRIGSEGTFLHGIVHIYCKTLIFGGNFILALLAIKAKTNKIKTPPTFNFQYIYIVWLTSGNLNVPEFLKCTNKPLCQNF